MTKDDKTDRVTSLKKQFQRSHGFHNEQKTKGGVLSSQPQQRGQTLPVSSTSESRTFQLKRHTKQITVKLQPKY